MSEITVPAPQLDVLCPVNYLIVRFPTARLSRAGFGELVDLVERDVIRVLDLEFVSRASDGTTRVVSTEEAVADAEDDLSMMLGSSSKLLDGGDVAILGDLLEPGSLGAVLVYENVWALPMLVALAQSRSEVIAYGAVAPEDLTTTLEATA